MDEAARPRHRPRKRFGQHFLHDRRVIGRIVSAVDPRPDEPMVEIGPGEGALTHALLEHAGRLHVVEIDRDLVRRLRREFAGRPQLVIHEADALRFDFAALAPAGERLRVVGNLPYNVSTPLLFHLLSFGPRLRDMHLMLQREVAERLAAAPGEAAYGRLTVGAALRARVERLATVAPGAFRPPPAVRSALVRLRVLEHPPVDVGDEAAFSRLVSAAFSARRKTVRNALRAHLAAEGIRAAGVDPDARPGTLSLDDFAALARALPAPGETAPVTHRSGG